MSRTYNPSDLEPLDPAGPLWAVTTARFLLRDTPNGAGAFPVQGYEDEELLAQLRLHALPYKPDPDGPETLYYRPHAVALALLLGNPDRILSFSASGYSETRIDLQTVRQGIEMQGQAIDDRIRLATGGALPPAGLGGLPWGF